MSQTPSSFGRAGRSGGPGSACGFTLIELIIVLFIMVLLIAVAAPMLSRLLKTSRVKIAADAAIAACFRARAEAQRFRTPVGVFFGDDLSKLPVAPKPNVLPPYGQIEIWTVKYAKVNVTRADRFRANTWEADEMGDGAMAPVGSSGWDGIPFWMQDKPLVPEPLTFPDGVRILAGHVVLNGGPPSYYKLVFTNYLNSPIGEIKRHTVTYAKNGCSVTWSDKGSYRNVIVFDTTTGEHMLVEVAEFKSSSRPRILMGTTGPLHLSRIGKRTSSGTTFPSSGFLTDYRQILTYIDQ